MQVLLVISTFPVLLETHGLKTKERNPCILCSSKVPPYDCFNQKWNSCRRLGRRVMVNLHLVAAPDPLLQLMSWCQTLKLSSFVTLSPATPDKMSRGLTFNNGHLFFMSHCTLGSLPRLPLSSVLFLPAFPSFSSLFTPPSTLTHWLNSWWKVLTARYQDIYSFNVFISSVFLLHFVTKCQSFKPVPLLWFSFFEFISYVR